MSRKSLPDDVCTTIIVPGDLYRTVKAACALEGISVREKVNELLKREFPDVLELPKRKRRQPSRLAPQMAEAE